MAGLGPEDLHALAQEFLAACEAALDTIPTFASGLVGAPARSYISPGQPAADCCDQLTVHIAAVTEAPTGLPGLPEGLKAQQGARINHSQLVATILRCVAQPTTTKQGYLPPAASELEASAQQLNADAWAMWNHIWNLIRAEQLFSLCLGVFWGGMRSLEPSGGCGGWVMSLTVTTEGYEEAIGT